MDLPDCRGVERMLLSWELQRLPRRTLSCKVRAMITNGEMDAVGVGDWVTTRCQRHRAGTVTQRVMAWLATGGPNGGPVDATSKPSPEVLGWIVKTIEDPDWVE
jgi:hypothetical protein